MAIQILRALSSATTVVAVDTAADKLAIAKRMGADEGLLSGDGAATRIKDNSHLGPGRRKAGRDSAARPC